MYQRQQPGQGQQGSYYGGQDPYAPLPTYKGGKDTKKSRKGQPLWQNPTVIKYSLIGFLAFILLFVMVSDRRALSQLKEENSRLQSSVYKHEYKGKNLADSAFHFQKESVSVHNKNKELQAKLSDAMEKVKNLEDFFEKHQHAHKVHSDEKSLWEKEKRYLHDEIEKIRTNFRDTRQGLVDSEEMGANPFELAEDGAKQAADDLKKLNKKNNPWSFSGKKKEAPNSETETDKAEEEEKEGSANTGKKRDLTASIVKQFKHHRYSYGGGDRQPETQEVHM